MPIEIQCAKCNQRVVVSDDSVGAPVTCPKCQSVWPIAAHPVTDPAEDSVHPIVWAAIGGGTIAVLALILGLILSAGDNMRPPEVVPAVAAVPTHVDPPSVVQNDFVQLQNKSDPSKEQKVEAEAPPTSAALPAKSSIEAGQPHIVEHSPAPPTNLSAEVLYARVLPYVVTIVAEDEEHEEIATGSGFFVDKSLLRGRYPESNFEFDKLNAIDIAERDHVPTESGYVITNFHVIRSAVFADVVLCNGDKGRAWDLVTQDEDADLALLKVTAPSKQPFKGLEISSSDPRVGAVVYAIGSPQGLSATISPGIVSGFRELTAGSLWLQTTAPISHGSSGGPLFLTDGTVAAITTLTSKQGQNLNFAIPASKIRTFLTNEYKPKDLDEGVSIYWRQESAFSEAYATLTIGRTANPAAEKLLSGAERELREGHFEQAIEKAKEAEMQVPNEYKYLCAYIIGKSSRALADRDKYASHPKTEKELYTNYRASNNAKLGEQNLKKAVTLKDDFAPAYYELAHHYTAGQQWPEALLASDKLVKLMPRCADAFELRSECYGVDRLAAAKSDLETAIELSPRNGLLHCNLGSLLNQLGEYDAAVKAYESSITASENPRRKFPASLAYYNIGNVYEGAGNFAKALSAFERAKAEGYFNHAEIDRLIQDCKQKLQ